MFVVNIPEIKFQALCKTSRWLILQWVSVRHKVRGTAVFLGKYPPFSCGAYIAVWCINWTVAERAVQRCKPPRNQTSLPAWAATTRWFELRSNPIRFNRCLSFAVYTNQPRLYQGCAKILFAPFNREKFLQSSLRSPLVYLHTIILKIKFNFHFKLILKSFSHK